jgi:hypothetical protein
LLLQQTQEQQALLYKSMDACPGLTGACVEHFKGFSLMQVTVTLLACPHAGLLKAKGTLVGYYKQDSLHYI